MLTRTDRRRFPILLAVIAALAMAMLFSPVQAQEGSVPDQPMGLEATATHDSVTLTWDDPGDDTITGYVILRRIPAVDPQGQFSELVSDTGTDATTYTDDTVSAETRYTYRIKAINGAGTSERSRWSHVDVPAAPEAVEGDDPDEQDGEGDGGGAPGGPGKRANVSEPSDGDCPGDVSTTCEVDVGGSVTGNISSRTDFDWFRVDLEADTRYQIDLEGEDTGRGTLPDPVLELYDGAGSFETDNETSGVGDNAREIYTPTATGTYYVGTGEVDGETGTYTLSVIVLGANGASEQDTDFPETTSTTGRVEVGASATGNIGTETDYDWFKVVLEANKTYQIDLEGDTGGGGTLGDPYLRNIRDSSGTEISGTENDDIVGGVADSRVVFTLTADGAYYLVASGFDGTYTGTYTLSVTELETRTEEGDTDFANDVTTLGRVEVGGSATGEIENVADSDWFRVVLEKDKTYVFDLEGTETSSGTLADPLLLLRDASGSTLEGDDDGGDGANSRLEYTATADGIHYLTATTPTSATSGGTYTLSVSEVVVLVSNIEEFHDSESNLYDEQMLTQAFSIAADSGDYTLTSIEIPIVDNGIAAADIESLSVSVWSTDSSGEPSASLHTLTNPGSITADTTATFNAQPGMTLTLEAGNTYAVLVRYDKALSTNFPSWASTEEYDQSGAVGWEIADESLTSETDNVNWVSSDLDIYRMRINGTAVGGDEPPCTLETGDIWCGVVDVGTITSSGGATQSHGFLGTTGGLSDETFSLMFETGTTNNYTIVAIVVGATTSNSEQLYFVTDSGLTDTEVESLALHVDGESDPFVWSDSTAVIPRSYRWPARTGLDWSSETTVTLRLREFPRPTVTNVAVTSMPALETDTYGAGETIEVSVTFSEAVNATSDTDFELNVSTDKSAPLLSGSGTETLVFGYTVAPDEEDDNGIWIGDQDRTLVGSRVVSAQSGTITSVATSATADLTHDALRTQPDHKVDGTRSIVSVEVTSEPLLETDTYGAGETIQFTVTFTAAVDVTGDPVLEFLFDGSELRQAGDVSGSGTTELVFGYTVVSGDDDDNGLFLRDESDYNNPDGPVRLDSNDEIEFKDTSTDAPLYWAGRGTQSGHKVDGSRTTGNNPPSFTTPATLSIPENTSHLAVVAEDNDAGDDITGYAITGGADNLFFAGVDFGDLQFDAAPNYENPQDSGADNTYEVTVQATSGTGTREMTATQTFTVTVTDVAEQSAKPDKPTLAAVSGSTTSLTATWTKPDLNGGPDITGYDLQYKESTESSWEDFAHTGTAVTTTITGLTADTSYEARVLAKNGETDSDWSDASDAVSTNAGTALPTLSIADAEGAEGSITLFPLTLSAAASGDVTVTCTASFESGDTAAAADLVALVSPATIQAGSTTGQCATVSAQDTIDENNETFTVTLSGVSSNAQLAADPTAEGTIEDDDPAPTLDVADATASEGDNLEFAVTLSAKSEKTVTAKWVAVHPDDTASTT